VEQRITAPALLHCGFEGPSKRCVHHGRSPREPAFALQLLGRADQPSSTLNGGDGVRGAAAGFWWGAAARSGGIHPEPRCGHRAAGEASLDVGPRESESTTERLPTAPPRRLAAAKQHRSGSMRSPQESNRKLLRPGAAPGRRDCRPGCRRRCRPGLSGLSGPRSVLGIVVRAVFLSLSSEPFFWGCLGVRAAALAAARPGAAAGLQRLPLDPGRRQLQAARRDQPAARHPAVSVPASTRSRPHRAAWGPRHPQRRELGAVAFHAAAQALLHQDRRSCSAGKSPPSGSTGGQQAAGWPGNRFLPAQRARKARWSCRGRGGRLVIATR